MSSVPRRLRVPGASPVMAAFWTSRVCAPWRRCIFQTNRIRKKSYYWPRYWVKSALRDEMWGTSDTRLGCEERHAVQLRELRGAGSKGSSIAADPADCGRSAGGAVAGI